MKKLLLMAAMLFVLAPLRASAQAPRVFDYQGEIDLMCGFDASNEVGYANLEIVNGIRFSRNLFVGAGLGLSVSLGDEAFLIPLFVDVKGYFPVARKVDLMAGIDLGTKLDCFYDTTGWLMRPEFGLHFQFNRNLGLNVSLFYEAYGYGYILDAQGYTNLVGLKLGFHF